MIHKVYRSDGSPNMARWQVSCDIPGCRAITPLMGSDKWLIPTHPDMRTFCPGCVNALADFAIGQVLHCRECESVNLDVHINDTDHTRPDHRWPNHITCADCGALYLIHDHHNTDGGPS